MQIASIEKVRARIAHLILGEPDSQRLALGKIELRPHQRSAVARLRESLREFGGAVLCDPVGTGKTFIALATPAIDPRLLVVAPAVLRDMWRRALVMAGRSAAFISFESLSRGSVPADVPEFVIVDEAHHARNPKTVRYRVLSQIVSRSNVLLLTATPIHNQRADLVALISLFLGERAASLTSSELAGCVIRRDQARDSIDGMPMVDGLIWMTLGENHRIPELLLSLPPPLPPRDGGDGGVLIARSLIRQWASSDAALTAGLRRRIVRAESLIAALSDNTWPTKQELRSWIAGDDSIQLVLPGMLAAETSDKKELLSVVQNHLGGLRAVLDELNGSSDAERVSLIRQIRLAHPDRSIVAFSEYADTITGLFGLLINDGRVCALTASGARVAGGAISRADAIAQFAPVANGHRPPPKANAITLLLTTDLLSEGVNLQDAGVVIHLDIPWTPARMEQRLGRVARVGSRHERIPSYAVRPPASSEDVIRIERILRDKLTAAGIVVPARSFLPGVSGEADCPTAPQRNEAIRSTVSEWLEDATETDDSSPVVAAVSSSRHGFIAIVDTGTAVRVLVSSRDQVSDNAESILDVLQQCCSRQVEPDPKEIQSCESAALSWIAADLAFHSSRPAQHSKTSIRDVVSRRIHRILRGARTHERARIAAKAERALAGVNNHRGAYDELCLLRACEQASDEEHFIDDVIELTADQAQSARQTPRILAMIVLIRQ